MQSGIKLMSHIMKIWERVIERRLRHKTHYRKSIWFYTYEVYHESDSLAIKIDGEILEE